jgi:hypothetical protein
VVRSTWCLSRSDALKFPTRVCLPDVVLGDRRAPHGLRLFSGHMPLPIWAGPSYGTSSRPSTVRPAAPPCRYLTVCWSDRATVS